MPLDPAPPPRPGTAAEPLRNGLKGSIQAHAVRSGSQLPRPGGLDRPALAAALRARFARLGAAGPGGPAGDAAISLSPEIDRALPGGGLPRAALHEILPDDTGAAQGFGALLMARSGGAVFWITTADTPPASLARFGVVPSNLVLLRPVEEGEALWAAEEALRCPAVSAVLLAGMAPGEEAMRRLQLAAETGGGIGLLLREAGDEEAAPSPAATLWRVAGRAGGAAGDLGDPQWTLDLLRCRAGRPRSWQVTWRAGMESLVPDEEAREEARAESPGRARRR